MKCADLRKLGLKIDKDFKKFVNECRDPKEYFKRKAEFMKIKTKMGLGENQMKINCAKDNCPSEFCSKLYDEIIEDISKNE